MVIFHGKMLVHQRVYPINIPLNHYKIPLNHYTPLISHEIEGISRSSTLSSMALSITMALSEAMTMSDIKSETQCPEAVPSVGHPEKNVKNVVFNPWQMGI